MTDDASGAARRSINAVAVMTVKPTRGDITRLAGRLKGASTLGATTVIARAIVEDD
jgi:hypothetical protein